MKLNSIHLQNFRSYKDWEFSSSSQGAVILGPNGSGKTNLLEAIAYSSLGKSFKHQSDDVLVRFEQKCFSIIADVELKMGNCRIECSYVSGKKRIKINQIPVKQISTVYEYLKVVYCSPDDISLINGSPRQRRQYFDLAVSQLNPFYIKLLRNYYHVVEQRNLLLKDKSQIKQKKHWDELFIKAALPVIGIRLNYIDMLNGMFRKSYADSLPEIENSVISYVPTLSSLDGGDSQKSYMDELNKIESREWQYQRTMAGPHLDDYLFLTNVKLLKDTGSQGQKRTIALITKIAHLELIKEAVGEYPILLLDDIFAELDKDHTKQFLRILQSHEQIFIATPNPVAVDYWNGLPIVNLAGDYV